MSSLKDRMIRAAKLDANLYEEVEADTEAMRQAMGVVVLSSLAAGLGTITKGGGAGTIPSILLGTVFALISWYAWAYLTYFIGTKFLPEPQTRARGTIANHRLCQLARFDSGIGYHSRVDGDRFPRRLNLDVDSNGDRGQTSPRL